MIEKLRPDQDLQCYFERPSAIAAISSASSTGFTLSGTWRQQFDWAVVEWNRDNVFEHPAFRSLPDGDLSGLTLTYDEVRENAIGVDSDLFWTVDWPFLRVWTRVVELGQEVERFQQVELKKFAQPIEGSYVPASATVTLGGAVTGGDHVGFYCLGERYNHQMGGGETIEDAAADLVAQINNHSAYFEAERSGAAILVRYVGVRQGGGRASISESTTGSNGNRLGLYTYTSGAQSESWDVPWVNFGGGMSPSKWRYTIPFGALKDRLGLDVLTANVRKLRWTYAAELQNNGYQRSEFVVTISNWTVTGTNRALSVAGRGSQRMEDDRPDVKYSGDWKRGPGNFSGGTISYTQIPGDRASWTYSAGAPHSVYVGTRFTDKGASVRFRFDGQVVRSENLFIAGEDILVRRKVGEYQAGVHTIEIEHVLNPVQLEPQYLYLDFFEVVYPTVELPAFPTEPKVTLATDWDTDHSLPLAPERTARMLQDLGFRGRHNYYVGALWFYELYSKGHQYASKTLTFVGTPPPETYTELRIVRDDYPPETAAVLRHLNWHGDSGETLAKGFEQEINRGYTAIRAEASGNQLKIVARALGVDPEHIQVTATPNSGDFRVEVEGGPKLSGAIKPTWTTDLTAVPRVNRACRDWSRAFFVALKAMNIDACAAFSTELQHGDDSVEAGIAQRYPDQSGVWLNTPALQTNFSPASIAYWRQVHLDMATLMAEAGIQPYLQFGEVQWWYFPKRTDTGELVGMTFYDEYTTSRFEAAYGRPLSLILSDTVDPGLYPEEAEFLPMLIGEYTDEIIAFVRQSFANARFEVLYPTDVNAGAFNQVINYPEAAWTPAKLDNLKTESFIYTLERRFEESRTKTIEFGFSKGFSNLQRSHLVGISSPPTVWMKEMRIAEAIAQDSIVLFALDQFCLIGYKLPLGRGRRRAMAHAR